MSYSPTVYRASMVTPRERERSSMRSADMDPTAWGAEFFIIRSSAKTRHGSGSKYSTSRGAEYASRWSSTARSPTWIWLFSSSVGTGITIANSSGSPW